MSNSDMLLNIKINFFKSIVNDQIDLVISNKKLNLLVGKNGVGKSNILKAISLISNNSIKNIEPSFSKDAHKYKNKKPLIKIINNKIMWNISRENNEVSRYFYLNESFLKKELKKHGMNFKIDSPGKYVSLGNEKIKLLKKEASKDQVKFIDELFSESKNLRVEYIENSENLNDFVYFHDLRLDFYEAEENGKQKDLNLLMILNFLERNRKLTKIDNSIDWWLTKYKEIFDHSNYKENEDDDDFDEPYYDDVDESNEYEKLENTDEDKMANLNSFEEEINSNFNKIIDAFFSKYFNKVFDFKFQIKIRNEKLYFEIKNKNEYIFDNVKMENASSGVKSLFYLLIRIEHLLYLNLNNKNSKLILLLDEPEKNLYPLLQMSFVKYLGNILKNNNLYIIYSTHHMSMIPEDDFTLNIVHRDEKGSSEITAMFGECNFNTGDCDNILYNDVVKKTLQNIILGNNEFVKIIDLKQFKK